MLICLFVIVYMVGLSNATDENSTEEKLININLGSCVIYFQNNCPYTDVTFHLYNNGEERVHISDNGTNLQHLSFNPQRETKILIHGYNSNRFLKELTYVKDEYLQQQKFNVFIVDWEIPARGPCYPIAVWNCRTVGKCASKLIEGIQLITDAKIHVVGFSLGAHVAGFISKHLTNKPIDRITGLDPALPGFTTVLPDNKLDSSDANFVDVIHTNAFVQGTPEQLGHMDFFVNGGILQPGCGNGQNILSCSHHRALTYFGESINSDSGFWAWSCNSYLDYLLGRCLKAVLQTRMGENINLEMRGMFILLTNPSAPFAIGPYRGPFVPSDELQDLMLHAVADTLRILFLRR